MLCPKLWLLRKATILSAQERSEHCSLVCPCCEKMKGYTFNRDMMALMDQQYKEALQSDTPAFLLRTINSFYYPNKPAIRPAASRSGCSQEVAPPPPYKRRPRSWGKFHQLKKSLLKKDFGL
ncbi:unnamed protein product [Penicillium salamii]|nr:unnamed protein product [Penicillium salamii]